jgi:hypothetical protein
VPEHARLILDRLTGVLAPYFSLSGLREDLDAASGRPMAVSRLRRGIHLAIQSFLLSPGLALVLLVSSGAIGRDLIPWELRVTIVLLVPVLWVLWASITFGGMSFALAGISLVRRDGRRAGRLAAGGRALLVWAAPTILLAACCYIQEHSPESHGLVFAFWIGTVVLLLVYAILALLFPARCLQDRLAGTVLVPL